MRELSDGGSEADIADGRAAEMLGRTERTVRRWWVRLGSRRAGRGAGSGVGRPSGRRVCCWGRLDEIAVDHPEPQIRPPDARGSCDHYMHEHLHACR